MAGAHGLSRLRPVPARLAERGAPLLVHPGPRTWTVPVSGAESPTWWPALTRYVADMSQA